MTDLAMRFHQHVKANSKCMVCGSYEHITFHHIKPADKITEICKIARTGDLTATITELNKTVPICEMDHTRIHRGKLVGWLDGEFDYGGPSTGEYAYQYSPYLNWLTKKRPKVFREFYERYIEPNNKALAPMFNAAGVMLLPQVVPQVVEDRGGFTEQAPMLAESRAPLASASGRAANLGTVLRFGQ